MSHKYVYLFSEGDASMRELLGGKGANLAEMTKIGLPVPQDRTQAGAQSGIPNSVKKPDQQLMGSPAIEPRTWWKAQAVIKQLPDMWTSMNRMKKEIEELKAQLLEQKKQD